ncbi:tRNA-2-methylthio-N(6)-dimethylallyladenosine synthase [Alphaproteobacteria bacterium]|nr:tRNA-2-methylthio-N(6)-dimethylallyladenosine synthase [Alphaproteobacteria bacterium]
MRTEPRTFHITTFGCQMNAYDSGRMADLLAAAGWRAADSAETADAVIFNTCHIRAKASEKVFSELGRLRHLPSVKAVAGCVAQAAEDEIRARAPFVAVIAGPQSYHLLPDLLARALDGDRPAPATEFMADEKFDRLVPAAATPRSAFLAVQEGCDRFCSYCVVPYTRGAEYSRPVASVMAEARHLAALGAAEITLLGQNVNAYHGGAPLSEVIARIADIPGVRRIRYTTSHPADMTDDLIAAHGAVGALMPCLHLPVQSGSDTVLRRMNRRHSAAQYLEIIDKLRAARSDIALSSDFIVGFPGETEADFEATLDLARRVGFANYFAFKFSAREGTAAADLDGQIPPAVSQRRLVALLEVLKASKRAYNRGFAGRTVEVLLTAPATGYTPWGQPVHIAESAGEAGDTAAVRITRALDNSLKGEAVREP